MTKQDRRQLRHDVALVFDWAERDQTECLSLGDDGIAGSATANLRLIRQARRKIMALLPR